MIVKQTYFAYGAPRSPEVTLPTDYTFTGQKADSYIKLIQMGSRWYDYELGRFTQPDTIIPNPYNPQSLNRYSYVNNNPINRTDPSGHGAPEDLRAMIEQILRLITNPRQAVTNACALTIDASCGRTAGIQPSISGLLESGRNYVQEKNGVNFGPPVLNPDAQKAAGRALEFGEWIGKNESMSQNARDYQTYVTGHTGDVYRYNGADFDGITEKGVLLDAKDHYNQFIDPKTGDFRDFYKESKTGLPDLFGRARKQIAAADGAPIEWHFSEEDFMQLLQKKFDQEGIEGIQFVYDPPLPPDDQ